MLMRRFEARTLHEALRAVERDCGRDALVVETRQTRDGFVVVAARPDDAAERPEPILRLPRPDGPADRRWTRGFAPLAERGLAFGLSIDVLRAVETALRDTRVALDRVGDPALPRLATRVLQGLVPTAKLTLPRFGVMAFVGPTGVGKTTTLAKLAARAIQAGERVAVVTIDTYRIAAVEQLRAFADLLRAPFEVAFTPADLRRAVAVHAETCDRVLIDTSGRSPLDRPALENLRATLAGVSPATVLCLHAGARRSDAVTALEAFDALTVDAVVVTKWDETRAPGEVVSLAIERGVPLSHVGVGQEVPDDIVVADAKALASSALDTHESQPFETQPPGDRPSTDRRGEEVTR